MDSFFKNLVISGNAFCLPGCEDKIQCECLVLGSFVRSCHKLGVWPLSDPAAFESSSSALFMSIPETLECFGLCSASSNKSHGLQNTIMVEIYILKWTGLKLLDLGDYVSDKVWDS